MQCQLTLWRTSRRGCSQLHMCDSFMAPCPNNVLDYMCSASYTLQFTIATAPSINGPFSCHTDFYLWNLVPAFCACQAEEPPHPPKRPKEPLLLLDSRPRNKFF